MYPHLGGKNVRTTVFDTTPRPTASGATTSINIFVAKSSARRRSSSFWSLANEGTSTSPMVSPTCDAGMSARLYARL